MNGEYNEYQQLRNEAKKAIRKFDLDAERTLLIEGNRAHFFKYVNRRLCKLRGSQITLRSDGSTLTTEAAAEAYNKEFFTNFTASTPPSGGGSRDSGSCVDVLRFSCSKHDVISAFKKCFNTAAGPDRISFATLKKIALQITYSTSGYISAVTASRCISRAIEACKRYAPV